MLKHWTSHAEYQHFISGAVSVLNESQRKKLYFYKDSIDKLTSLNLDPIHLLLKPRYSTTGRPATNQPEIIRSLVLMLDQECLSLNKWVDILKSDDLLATMIGCTPDSLPPLGSYYDFINRLWLQHPDFEKLGRKDWFPSSKNKKSKLKPGKDKKLPNRHSGITEVIADYVLNDNEFPFHYEKLLQELFSLAAIVPSIELGLIPTNGATISGDGTCVHAHANPNGRKICKCYKSDINNCECDYHYSDPDAAWGWDSDLKKHYYGHTLYMLVHHNDRIKTDLPLHIRFVDARRHDSVTALVSLAEFRKLHPDFKINNLCLDSANDNYPTYELCEKWSINPFIDLNANRGASKSIPDHITIDKDGTPLCHAGNRMVYWGFCPDRTRLKWRCPLACGKVEKCSSKKSCSPSPYGRCKYTKPEWDIRLYPPIPRGTNEYKKIYNHRTGSERVNNRMLNDYHLHDMIIHSKKRFSFFAMIAGINIHLDARLKQMKLAVA